MVGYVFKSKVITSQVVVLSPKPNLPFHNVNRVALHISARVVLTCKWTEVGTVQSHDTFNVTRL